MQYTVKQMSTMSGVTPRTIRYYDQIGLLQPAAISKAGYRLYTQKEVNLLQQILFFRALGVDLSQIHSIVNSKTFDPYLALQSHRVELLKQKEKLDQLIYNVDKSIASLKGENTMTNEEKFEGLKQELVAQNEKKYGKEIREKYGKETIEASNKHFSNLSKEQFEQMETLGKEILQLLKESLPMNDPLSEKAQLAAQLHQEWLGFTWPNYSEEAHKGLANMYVQDERFTAYYDNVAGQGAAQLLRDAIHCYLK